MPRATDRHDCFAAALALVLLFGAAGASQARVEHYGFDTVHSQVLFFVSHLGFSHSMGRFPGLSGELVFDRDDWSTARVEARIDVASLYLGDEAWQKKVLGRDFFDLRRHPTMHFVSERIEPVDADDARVHGQLTLRGVTRPVVLQVHLNRIGRHTYSLKYVAGFSATTTLKRSEFGMSRMLPAVGDEVEVRLEIEALRGESQPQEKPH